MLHRIYFSIPKKNKDALALSSVLTYDIVYNELNLLMFGGCFSPSKLTIPLFGYLCTCLSFVFLLTLVVPFFTVGFFFPSLFFYLFIKSKERKRETKSISDFLLRCFFMQFLVDNHRSCLINLCFLDTEATVGNTLTCTRLSWAFFNKNRWFFSLSLSLSIFLWKTYLIFMYIKSCIDLHLRFQEII